MRAITKTSLSEALDAREISAMCLEGLHCAVLGVTMEEPGRLVYSRKAIIGKLMLDGMSFDAASEHFDFNIASLYIGEQTPLIIDDMEDAECP